MTFSKVPIFVATLSLLPLPFTLDDEEGVYGGDAYSPCQKYEGSPFRQPIIITIILLINKIN